MSGRSSPQACAILSVMDNGERGTMKTRKRAVIVGCLVLLAAALAAGLTLAQGAEEVTIEDDVAVSDVSFLGRVAANLGIDEAALVDAIELARTQEIDAAAADGRLTQEQAAEMKARIEARQALRDVLDEAIASGRLTEEQAQLLRLREQTGGSWETLREGVCAWRGARGGIGFTLGTPRGTFGGRIEAKP
jgi:hypothetical protein